MSHLGIRIRELRQNRNLTLEQVAAETGLSASFLSMVERDKVSISVDNLEKLARYFEVHMVHFFSSPEENPVLITRRDQITNRLTEGGHEQASVTLLANRLNARLEPLLVTIAPGKEEPHFRQHESDTLLYIIKGRALLIAETGGEIELNQGDLAYYVNQPHRRVANANPDTPLLMLVITSPPTTSLDDLIEARQSASMAIKE